MHGKCRLCGIDGILEESHLIPNFISKWSKKTSATGFMRHADNPNKRVQDFAKEHWLCGSCEDLFAKWEREFATKVFYSFVDNGKRTANYTEWMAKFCASLSWRTLTYIRHRNPDSKATMQQRQYLDRAHTSLADFMLGRLDNLHEFEQHLFLVGGIQSTTTLNISRSINRYILRTVAMDIITSKTEIFLYTKLPSFILLGFVKVDEPSKMRSSRIALKSGKVGAAIYYWPTGFMEYLTDKANQITKQYAAMSEEQREHIDRYILNNPERFANSRTFQAFMEDYKLFGDDVFRE